MRITAKAEYACFAMLELALNYQAGRPVRVAAIADAHGIDSRFLVQILIQLGSKGAGLVTSVRGQSGGYQLARPPAEISLADIIYAIDRPSSPRALAETPSPVVQVIRGVWKEIDAHEQGILEQTTLAELVQRVNASAAMSYQI
jgi:Rrf2 family protein